MCVLSIKVPIPKSLATYLIILVHPFILAVLSFLSVIIYWVLRLHPLITFQACQIAANFTTNWELLLALAYMNVTMQSSKLNMFVNLAFKISKWEAEFSIYFTVDVMTLWTWFWSSFALTNWSFCMQYTEDGRSQKILCPHESICAIFPIGPSICWIVFGDFLQSL